MTDHRHPTRLSPCVRQQQPQHLPCPACAAHAGPHADRSSSTSYAWAIRSNLPNPGSCFENASRSRACIVPILRGPASCPPQILVSPNNGYRSITCALLSLSQFVHLLASHHRRGLPLQMPTGAQVNRTLLQRGPFPVSAAATSRPSSPAQGQSRPEACMQSTAHALRLQYLPDTYNSPASDGSRPMSRQRQSKATQNTACDRSTHTHTHSHTTTQYHASVFRALHSTTPVSTHVGTLVASTPTPTARPVSRPC